VRWVEHEESQAILRRARTIAVLGIKPESRPDEAAFWTPQYLASVGYRIFPVPTHFPDVETILGSPVHPTVADIATDLDIDIDIDIDIVSVFQRPSDVPRHVPDLLAASPGAVWFQSGCLDVASAERLWRAGLSVVCSCIGCTRATIDPTQQPLPAQREP